MILLACLLPSHSRIAELSRLNIEDIALLLRPAIDVIADDVNAPNAVVGEVTAITWMRPERYKTVAIESLKSVPRANPKHSIVVESQTRTVMMSQSVELIEVPDFIAMAGPSDSVGISCG